ncbi:MAG: molybdopterin-synthase adenylyltransferase MoeB [Candidatus Omnitrophica bacterium]|nr:molybdopterin-synthase adenylyltransferase MoeB [Candidatus Omnitrophota bacterium]
MQLTPEQLTRYSRHFILPEIGEDGQKKLLCAKVLLIGAGGLGSPLGLYLSAAGVGTIGLVDFDRVDLSNLQRQILHTNDEVGNLKVDSAERRIKAMNPDTKVIKHVTRLTSQNALEILKDYDIIIDGTDNFPTRYLTNDACVFLGKPNIYGSIFRFDGLATVFKTDEGPCYRCLYPEPPPPGMVPSCAEGGVLGILPGTIGLIQATEAIKLIVGIGRTLVGRLIVYDALQMTFRELKLRKDPSCPVCGTNPTIKQLIDYEQFCGITRGGQKSSQGGSVEDISVEDLKAKLDRKEDFVFIDVRESFEAQIAKIPGAKLIPLGQLEGRLSELESFKGKEIVAHCHHGGRSRRALEILSSKGFTNLKNVNGGIDEWSVNIDPTIPRY